MCLPKVSSSSIVTPRSYSTEPLGFTVMLLIDRDAGLFYKFLFAITIVWIFFALTIVLFDISPSVVILDSGDKYSDAAFVKDADNVLPSA